MTSSMVTIHMALFAIGLFFCAVLLTRSTQLFPKRVRLGLMIVGISYIVGALLGAMSEMPYNTDPVLASACGSTEASSSAPAAASSFYSSLQGDLAKAFSDERNPRRLRGTGSAE